MLRWSTAAGDARQTHPARQAAAHAPFLGERPPVVTRAEYRRSGFTGAHLDPARFWGYRTLATMVTEVERLLRAGEPFVYAYYDGLDKVAHEYGLGEHYDAELAWIDHTVERILLPAAPARPGGHRRPRPGRGAAATSSPLAGDVLAPVLDAVGRGPVPLAARPPGRAPDALGGGRRAPRRRRLGATRDEVVDERLVRPGGDRGGRSRLGDVAGGRPHRRGLPRPARHRPLRAGGPARVAHPGRDAGPAARAGR